MNNGHYLLVAGGLSRGEQDWDAPVAAPPPLRRGRGNKKRLYARTGIRGDVSRSHSHFSLVGRYRGQTGRHCPPRSRTHFTSCRRRPPCSRWGALSVRWLGRYSSVPRADSIVYYHPLSIVSSLRSLDERLTVLRHARSVSSEDILEPPAGSRARALPWSYFDHLLDVS